MFVAVDAYNIHHMNTKNNKVITYALTQKVIAVLAQLPQLDGKYNREATVSVPRGSEGFIEVNAFAASLVPYSKNPYAPTRQEVLAAAQNLLKLQTKVGNSTPQPDVAAQAPTSVALSTETTDEERPQSGQTHPINEDVSDVVSTEQNQIALEIAGQTGYDFQMTAKITAAVMARLSNSYMLGLVALANSLHYIAAAHDKLPGHERRIKSIEDIKSAYVEAGMLTSRPASRS
jgi:hypothetical protein